MNRRGFLGTSAVAATVAGTAPVVVETKTTSGRSSTRAQSISPSELVLKDGVRLFVRDWGAGRPVVFLHSWALASDMWSYQTTPLAEGGYRTVAFDRRGHGRSSDPGRGYDYDTLADDLAQVIEALNLTDLTLVSHSFGAGEAIRYLTRHGSGRVRDLVFLAPAGPPFLLKTSDNPYGLDGAVFEGFRRQILLKDYPRWLEDGKAAFFTADTSMAIKNWLQGIMLQASMKALYDCNRAMVTTDFRGELAQIKLPVLIIQGNKDASSPMELSGVPMAKMIPSAEFKLYEGAPHGLFVTHMDQLNADLALHLRG
jgi:non-heme chloroperoxidase